MIDVAIEAARQAGALAYRYFKTQSTRVTYKPDNSPVTKADIEAEKLIRKIIIKKFPDHGIIGEELPAVNPDAKFKWIIDPIDGTKEFVRGIKTWSVLLALLENTKPVIGVAYYPYSDEIFVAQKGKGALLNGKKTEVSKVKDLKVSAISHGSVNRFQRLNKLSSLAKICATVQSRRSLSTLGYNLLWKGQVDVVLEPGGGIQDFAAPSIITKEAGGKFTDFDGRESITSGTGILSNGLIHNKVLKILNS